MIHSSSPHISPRKILAMLPDAYKVLIVRWIIHHYLQYLPRKLVHDHSHLINYRDRSMRKTAKTPRRVSGTSTESVLDRNGRDFIRRSQVNFPPDTVSISMRKGSRITINSLGCTKFTRIALKIRSLACWFIECDIDISRPSYKAKSLWIISNSMNWHNLRQRSLRANLPCTSNICKNSPVMLVILIFLPGEVQTEGGGVGSGVS